MVKTYPQLLELIRRLRKDRHYGGILVSMTDGKVTHAEVRHSIKVKDDAG